MSPSPSVITVGHSLGGAIAELDAIFLKLQIPSISISARTYGLPRVGNDGFASFAQRIVPDSTHVTNKAGQSSVRLDCGMTSHTLTLSRYGARQTRSPSFPDEALEGSPRLPGRSLSDPTTSMSRARGSRTPAARPGRRAPTSTTTEGQSRPASILRLRSSS